MTVRMTILATTVALLASCSGTTDMTANVAPDIDPLLDVERLSDVTVAPDADTVAMSAPAGQSGFFAEFLTALNTPAPPRDTNIIEAAAGTTQPASSGGLFGFGGATQQTPRNGPDALVVPFGTALPFGEIATVCDAPRGGLGTRIASVSGYEVFDSVPNSVAPRAHYITGFPDGCVRQFSAALAMTGDVGTHEVVRYTGANAGHSYSATDNAYEAIKASFCRASHGSPCGARLDALADNTTFVSVYERFGTNDTWFEILLHGGAVTAVAMRSD